MLRVAVICEGQTEANFVQTCLSPELNRAAFWVDAVILGSRHSNHKGGRVSVERLAVHMARLRGNYDRLTTLVDHYGFENPLSRSRQELEAAISAEAIKRGCDARVVLPYVQMYEFEALLFSDVRAFEHIILPCHERELDSLAKIRTSFEGPEAINNSRETAPSKRIQAIFGSRYQKAVAGPLIAREIGLNVIRRACPQFHAWVIQLEGWAAEIAS